MKPPIVPITPPVIYAGKYSEITLPNKAAARSNNPPITQKNRPPKLPLTVGSSAVIKFGYSTPKEGETKYGHWWLWGISKKNIPKSADRDEYENHSLMLGKREKDLAEKLLKIPIQMGDEIFLETREDEDKNLFWDIGLMEDDKVVQTLSTKVQAKEKAKATEVKDKKDSGSLETDVADEVGAIFKGCCSAFGLDPESENLPDGIFRVVNTVIMRKMK